MFVGTVVSTVERFSAASGHEARLFAGDEFTERFGRSFKSSKDYIGVMNADGAAVSEYLHSRDVLPRQPGTSGLACQVARKGAPSG